MNVTGTRCDLSFKETVMDTIALFGAAGKIGTRISEKLRDDPAFRTLYVEAGAAGLGRLRQRGLTPSAPEEAIREGAPGIVPQLQSGTLVILLDPAAPHGGELPEREDIAYFCVHPCHPPIVKNEIEPEARNDFWGGRAKQNIVCALMQGTEEDYAKGERIARKMFAPILNAHRITVEQMAVLEPAMAETVILTCMVVMREAIEETIRSGVPRQVAYDFALGHMGVNLGILFGYIDAEVSEGARLAVERAKQSVFQPDWKKVFEPPNVIEQVRAIVEGRSSKR
jgi:hypothetical protein